MRNMIVQETVLVGSALGYVRGLLPAGWTVTWEPLRTSDRGVDGALVFRSPDGSSLTLATEVKEGSRGSAAETVERVLLRGAPSGLPVLLIADYANPALRRECASRGVSFVDTTGWVSISAPGPPGLSIRAQGAERAPEVRPSGINRLDGPGASRVIRTLCELNRDNPTRGVRELAAEAGVSPGTVSKVLPALESYGAIERDGTGRILRRDRRLLLDRWAQDYSFRTSHRRIGWYLAPRGLEGVLNDASQVPAGFRIGGTGPQVAHKTLTGAGRGPGGTTHSRRLPYR